MADLSIWQLALVALVVGVGSIVQGTIGFGFALTSASVVSLIEPDAVPGTLLLLAFPINALIARRERHAIDRIGVMELTIGLAVGTVLGVLVLRDLSREALQVAFGAAIIAAVVLSIAHPHIRLDRRNRLGGGTASGLITTVAATGGPAIALLYQRRPGPELRGTLAAAFFISATMSVVGLAFADRIGWLQVRLALVALPGLLGGLALSARLAPWLDETWLRPAVLVFAAGAGAAAIATALI